MPWSRSRPGGSTTQAKYRSKEHTQARAEAMAQLKRAGSGSCAEPVCVHRSRLITPSMKLHLCHDRRTGQVRGLGHAKCNLSEAGRFARSIQNATALRW